MQFQAQFVLNKKHLHATTCLRRVVYNVCKFKSCKELVCSIIASKCHIIEEAEQLQSVYIMLLRAVQLRHNYGQKHAHTHADKVPDA